MSIFPLWYFDVQWFIDILPDIFSVLFALPHALGQKVLDYGKYRYELQKKEKEARKKQKTTQVKEIRLSTFIEEHDIQVKANTAAKFLKDGDKVKVSVRFRGREVTHSSLGQDLLHRFAELCSECSTVEKQPKLEGRQMLMFLAPAKDK